MFFQVASHLCPRHEQPGQHPEGEERAGRGRAAALQSRFYSVCFFKTLTKNLPSLTGKTSFFFTDSSLFFFPPHNIRGRRDFAAAWMNLGIVQNSLREFEKAEQSYWNAIRFRKKYPDCYYNLGRLVRDSRRCFPGAYLKRMSRNEGRKKKKELI